MGTKAVIKTTTFILLLLATVANGAIIKIQENFATTNTPTELTNIIASMAGDGGLSFTPQYGSLNLSNWATLNTNILLSLGGGSSAWADITGKPTTLLGYGITDAQPLDSDLTSIAALSTTAFGRGLLDDADAASVRITIGAGISSFDGVFSSLTSKPTTIAGYGITDYNLLGDARWQPLDAELTAWAALATSAKQDADADLTDLADGSLTGSKVGTGINGDNITSGTVADARIDTALTRTTQLNAASNAIVAQIAEAGGGDVTTAQLNSASNVLWQAKVDSTNSTRLATQLALASTYQPLDADLTDLADGSLTGSKVGSGISGDNVTTGTVADARVASTIARDSEVTAAVAITASGFNGNLTTTDDTIQELAQAVDDLVLGGSSDYDTNTFTGTGPLVRATNAVLHTPTFTGGVTADVLNVPLLRSTTAGNTNVIAAWGATGNSTNVQFGPSISYDPPTRTLAVALDASGFNGHLATTDDTVQEVAQKLDDLSVGGGTTVRWYAFQGSGAGSSAISLAANAVRHYSPTVQNLAGGANGTTVPPASLAIEAPFTITNWYAGLFKDGGTAMGSGTNSYYRLYTNGVFVADSMVTVLGGSPARYYTNNAGWSCTLSDGGFTNTLMIQISNSAACTIYPFWAFEVFKQ